MLITGIILTIFVTIPIVIIFILVNLKTRDKAWPGRKPPTKSPRPPKPPATKKRR